MDFAKRFRDLKTRVEVEAELWLDGKDFTMKNRRQTARAGFIAGYKRRKELTYAKLLQRPPVKTPFEVALAYYERGFWSREKFTQAVKTHATDPNWFIDRTGKVWVDDGRPPITPGGPHTFQHYAMQHPYARRKLLILVDELSKFLRQD